jgi:DNA-directed RNA polymerase II subunit RPB1
MDNEGVAMLKAIEHKGRPIKCVASRIKGKEGRIRANLMGKRGDFTARTVITSDPSIRNNQLRVPVAIATNLTFPEVVGPDNIDELTILVKRGRDEYPGANFVFPLGNSPPGKRILPKDLRIAKDSIKLHYGDVVERHLRNDDVVLLNRQPTLHKQSMMAFRIKVVNDPNLMTFGMSVDITDSYNAKKLA